ncbi:MAG: biopolymer transporter ExbD [Bdellovibrionales bacterium]|nr:biopolymer transporter ExbD [Bdellovibrionales bacterium]
MPLQKARLRISDYNRGRKNRLKDQEKKVQEAALSLTSMVDMFATLVVYLIMTSTSLQEWVGLASNIELPKGRYIGESPQKGAAIQVTKDMVFGELDVELISIAQIAKGPFSVAAIKDYLKQQENKNGYVNVVADYSVPFGVMRKIIASCQDAGFKNVNLAIEPIGPT